MKPIRGARERVVAKRADSSSIDLDAAEQREHEEWESERAPHNERGLRLDGPILEQFVAAGYSASAYPPTGYAALDSPGWDVEKARRAEVTRQAGEAFIADATIPDHQSPEPEGEP